MTVTTVDVIRPHAPRPGAPRKAIIFDADDTLWVTEWLYDQARQEANLLVCGAGLDEDRWFDRYRELNVQYVAKYGYTTMREPAAAITAYVEMAAEAGLRVEPKVIASIDRAFAAVYQRTAPLVGHVREVLEALRPDYQLIMVTKGDHAVQVKRIRDSGLAPLFDGVVIADGKDAALFARVVAEFGVDPAQSWAVGNSLHADVETAVSLGMRGIWIPANAFLGPDTDTTEPALRPGITKLGTLVQILRHIRGHAAPEREVA